MSHRPQRPTYTPSEIQEILAIKQAEKTMMTEFMGFPMENQTRTIIIDLLVALFVIAMIVLPQICCKVTGRNLRNYDEWEKIYEKHKKEALDKQKEKESLLKKRREQEKKLKNL